MDLYLVLDLSISITQNVDYHRSSKVQRALCFAETLIKEIDKNEVTVHLIYLVGYPVLVKCGVEDPSLVRPLFKKAVTAKTKEVTASDYKALRDLISSHKTSYNFEVLIATDLSEEIPFPVELKLPCLLRFVILTDIGSHEEEYLSENLIAALECVSMNCGLEAMFGTNVSELTPELHLPLMVGDYDSEVELATVLAKESRTVKDVSITLSPAITLKATLSPGLPKRLVVMEEEMLHRYVNSKQSPVFKFVGAAPASSIIKLSSTELVFEVCPRVEESQQNTDAFRKLFDALVETKTVAVLMHSSGEECFLRPLKFSGSVEDCALVIQFYASQYVEWKLPQDQTATNEFSHQFSYKYHQLYWHDAPDIQTDVNKLCRRLKKDPSPRQFYEDLKMMCEFAIASGFTEFSSDFAQLLEKRGFAQDLSTNQVFLTVLKWLRSPKGFQVTAGELTKVLQTI